MTTPLSRDDLAERYFDQLPYTPYPVQEEALLSWFACEQGVLVCAPTGTGKTLIAEAAAFEGLHTGRTVYYTTPLIALTEQKFAEMQEAAVRWGFSEDDVGLVTGNRRVNPNAKLLVVVAEILLNRLLHPESSHFDDVSAVVMDEFHSFNDPERGIVWELSLSMLPSHVRTLLLSATVGNAVDFSIWLYRQHGRRLDLVQGTERKVPLAFRWVPDMLLGELLPQMAEGEPEDRRTPALVFCFNRDECWNVAEQLKGRAVVSGAQQKELAEALKEYDWTTGAGKKFKPILQRGVGVHHAGVLPRYRRIVEDLFQRRLLSVTVCTETLAAGINLPARSVVLPTLLKGPRDRKKVIDPSSAHQIFGRAGRPQFDHEGFVYVLAHEDDVKILRWKERYDQIPEDTKDPQLIKAKKSMKKKMPTRRNTVQYWNEEQFQKLVASPPAKLSSRGLLPWRLLAYLLLQSTEVSRVRDFVRKRLMDDKTLESSLKHLDHMLVTLHAADMVKLTPAPPSANPTKDEEEEPAEDAAPPAPADTGGWLKAELNVAAEKNKPAGKKRSRPSPAEDAPAREEYQPKIAEPTAHLPYMMAFRSINPLYGLFLVRYFPVAADEELLQALESTLELPGSVLRHVRVPSPRSMPPGSLAREFVDPLIVEKGILSPGELYPEFDDSLPPEERLYPPPLAEKLKMLFDAEFPHVHGLRINATWAAGGLLDFNGDFDKFISGRDLAKQEGLIFRHLLKLILLCKEFLQVPADYEPTAVRPVTAPTEEQNPESEPDDADGEQDAPPADWRSRVAGLAEVLTESCRNVDPESTDKTLEEADAPDPFGEGIF